MSRPNHLLLLLGALLIAMPPARAVDIEADSVTRNADGAIVAEGNVVIVRKQEKLTADRVTYDAAGQQMEATGHVTIETEKATIHADEARMHTGDKTGEIRRASATLSTGERIKAETFRRLDEGVYRVEDAQYSACPPESESWRLTAESATLDQQHGTLTAHHARLEVGGIPVFYTPYWRHTLQRKSGFLMPQFGTSNRRGTEWALPFYLAPAEDWDATITPHWMTARGLMGQIEMRHVSFKGHETIRVEGLHDQLIRRSRGRIEADIQHSLPAGIRFELVGDHITDLDYLADFPIRQEQIAVSYLLSQASLSATGEYGDWQLLGRHQQNLKAQSNAATLQIAPRFESHLRLPVAGEAAWLHFDQQSTRFMRRQGVDGWRVDLNPYLELPWELAGGAVQSTLTVGGRHSRYWLQDTAGNRTPHRNSFEASLDNRITFERISSDRNWRHAVMPVLRFDLINAPDQSTLPNFDSAFGRLTMSNLMGGNRFTGHDRIERMRRISAMLETELQHRQSPQEKARTLVRASVGAAYDMQRQTVDAAVSPAPTRPFSNLLGAIALYPWEILSINAAGQFDPVGKYWPTAQASAALHIDKSSLSINWQRTDGRYADAAEVIAGDASIFVTPRWRLFGRWQYDLRFKLTQQAGSGIQYIHPCWDMQLEGYRTNLAGSTTLSDFGFRFLLGFKGLGSVGS